ncbi:hypothetical protein R1sor_019470 [Riccia sorocarpa]|uniref:Uncharacterized protein n=1 Tax=Riccia sorocarpa TaxID=122646 RepID=A0ABD3ICQ9_9MARC
MSLCLEPIAEEKGYGTSPVSPTGKPEGEAKLDACKEDLVSTKKQTEDLSRAKTSTEAEVVKLKKKIKESHHEVKRAQRKIKSSQRKKKQLKAEVKAQDMQLIEAEDIAQIAENEVDVQ